MKQIVRAFLKNDEGKYLLVQHTGKSDWILPGGHVEKGESIYKAIKREIKEELNFNIKILGNKLGLDIENIKEKSSPVCIYKINFESHGKNVNRTEYIFLAQIKSGEIKIQEKEIGKYSFFTKEEILNLDNTFLQIKEILKNIA